MISTKYTCTTIEMFTAWKTAMWTSTRTLESISSIGAVTNSIQLKVNPCLPQDVHRVLLKRVHKMYDKAYK